MSEVISETADKKISSLAKNIMNDIIGYIFNNIDKIIKLKLFRYTNIGEKEFRKNNISMILIVVFIILLYKCKY